MTKLQFVNNGVNSFGGPLPTQLGRLTELLTWDVSQNAMDGTIPTEVGLLTKLTALWLFGNKLSGTCVEPQPDPKPSPQPCDRLC